MGRLANYDDDFTKTAATDPNAPIEDGVYHVMLSKLKLDVDKNGDDRLSWQWTILGPKFAGRVVFGNSSFADSTKLGYLKLDLARCGFGHYKPSMLEDPENLLEMIGTKMEARIKTNGKYTNIYLNRKIEGSELTVQPQAYASKKNGLVPATEEGPDDSGLPF